MHVARCCVCVVLFCAPPQLLLASSTSLVQLYIGQALLLAASDVLFLVSGGLSASCYGCTHQVNTGACVRALVFVWLSILLMSHMHLRPSPLTYCTAPHLLAIRRFLPPLCYIAAQKTHTQTHNANTECVHARH